ncbi:MAG: hypothetical protein QNK37_38980 [Acidobacteriota bacterium]|nr:hypothetical protein [Acidobacteriota bacterium]
MKYVSLGLNEAELESIETIKDYFKLPTSAGAVRKSLAFMAACTQFMGKDKTVEVTDAEGNKRTIILA